MSWKHWALAGTLATTLTTHVFAQEKQPNNYKELHQSAQHIGNWAVYSLQKTTQEFQDTVRVNGRRVVASYNRVSQKKRFTNPFTDTPRNRATLAHELTHYLLDESFGTTGLINHPDYQGPSRKEILDFTAEWYQSEQLRPARQNVERIIHLLTHSTHKKLANDHQKAITIYTKVKPYLNLGHQEKLEYKLQELNKHPKGMQRIAPNFAILYPEPDYEQKNKDIDAFLYALRRAIPIRQTNYFRAGAHASPLLVNNPQLWAVGTQVDSLIDQRREQYWLATKSLRHIENYYSDPEETFARAVGSLIQQYQGSTNKHRYSLDDKMLQFLLEMRFKGEHMFLEHVENYLHERFRAAQQAPQSTPQDSRQVNE